MSNGTIKSSFFGRKGDVDPKVRALFKSRSSSGAPSWWLERYADIVDRRLPDGTYEPRPKKNHNRKTYPLPASPSEMLPRPDGMSRQVQRALYRKACKASGFDYRGYGRVNASAPTPEITEALKAHYDDTAFEVTP